MDRSISIQRPEELKYGWIGWLGFFVLCCLGMGLVLLAISWGGKAFGNLGGPDFVIKLSQAAGVLTVWFGCVLAVVALVVGLVLFVAGN